MEEPIYQWDEVFEDLTRFFDYLHEKETLDCDTKNKLKLKFIANVRSSKRNAKTKAMEEIARLCWKLFNQVSEFDWSYGWMYYLDTTDRLKGLNTNTILFLFHHCPKDGTERLKNTILEYFIEKRDQEKVRSILVDHKVRMENHIGGPMSTAVCEEDLETMQLLLDCHGDWILEMDCEGEKGTTPLSWAFFSGKLNSLEFLLKKGADITRSCSDPTGCYSPTNCIWVCYRECGVDKCIEMIQRAIQFFHTQNTESSNKGLRFVKETARRVATRSKNAAFAKKIQKYGI